ncbi:MAG TPA: hypothetical protein VJ799_13830 [Nitrososphaeraceae archaeon]|nr:hypothetical protein [Nitrososphaeraceae archaeon]
MEQSRKQDKRNLFFLSVWKMQEEVKWLKASLNKYAGHIHCSCACYWFSVINSKFNGALGTPFIAFAPFV